MQPGARPGEASALVLERGEAGQQSAALILPGLPPVAAAATQSHVVFIILYFEYIFLIDI